MLCAIHLLDRYLACSVVAAAETVWPDKILLTLAVESGQWRQVALSAVRLWLITDRCDDVQSSMIPAGHSQEMSSKGTY